MQTQNPPLETSRNNDVVVSPSFSSSLLDQIYFSIENTAKQSVPRTNNPCNVLSTSEEMLEEEKSTMRPEEWPISLSSEVLTDHKTVSEWIMSEKAAACTTTTTTNARSEKLGLPPPPLPLHPPRRAGDDPDSFFSTTSASSSDSGIGSGFSSETESFSNNYRKTKPKLNSCLFFGPASWPKMKSKLKPIKTSSSNHKPRFGQVEVDEEEDESGSGASPSSSSSRLKKKAVKIYSQMKHQPGSPSVKVAKYINSIFNKESTSTVTRKKRNSGSSYSDSQGWERNFTGNLVSERRVKSDQTSPVALSVKEMSVVAGLPVRSLLGVKCVRRDREEYEKTKDVEKRIRERLVRGSNECGSGRTSRRYGGSSVEGEHQRIENRDDNDDDVWRRQVLEEVAMELNMNGGGWDHVWNGKGSDIGIGVEDDEEEEMSCSSSELFELEHLSLIGDDELHDRIRDY